MLKFIIILVLIFTVFLVGGSLLFDSGIADSKGVSRVPLAVQTEKVFYQVRGVVVGVGGQIFVVVQPLVTTFTNAASGPKS